MPPSPSDAEAILSALEFDTNWLLEASNDNHAQFIGHEERLYSILGRLHFVTCRFARVYE